MLGTPKGRDGRLSGALSLHDERSGTRLESTSPSAGVFQEPEWRLPLPPGWTVEGWNIEEAFVAVSGMVR